MACFNQLLCGSVHSVIISRQDGSVITCLNLLIHENYRHFNCRQQPVKKLFFYRSYYYHSVGIRYGRKYFVIVVILDHTQRRKAFIFRNSISDLLIHLPIKRCAYINISVWNNDADGLSDKFRIFNLFRRSLPVFTVIKPHLCRTFFYLRAHFGAHSGSARQWIRYCNNRYSQAVSNIF